MKVIQAIAFDMDGTIIDSEPVHQEVEFEMYAAYGMDVPRAGYERFQGMRGIDLFTELVAAYAPGRGLDPQTLVFEKRARMLERYRGGIPTIPGAIEFIFAVRKRFPLVLVTSTGSEVVNVVLSTLGLTEAFGFAVTGDMIEIGKPHPEPYRKAVRHLERSAAQVAVIEDSANGIRSAKAAGCLAIGILTSETEKRLMIAGADLVIDDYADLHRIFNV